MKGISALVAVVLFIAFIIIAGTIVFEFGKGLILGVTAPLPERFEQVIKWIYERLELTWYGAT